MSELRAGIAATREAVQESQALAELVGVRLRALTDENVVLRRQLAAVRERYEVLVAEVRAAGRDDLVEDGV